MFSEAKSKNRKSHVMEPDPRIAFFSNNGTIGTTGVGVEGWHVDGNVAENPHSFTLIY